MEPVDLDAAQDRHNPAGTEYEPTTFNKASLRAELVELANQVSFKHGPRIVDKILARYDVKRKSLKEKK